MKTVIFFFAIAMLLLSPSFSVKTETFELKHYEYDSRSVWARDLGSVSVEASKEFPSGLKRGQQNASKGTRYYTPQFAGRKIFFALDSSHGTAFLYADTDMDNDLYDEKGYAARQLMKDIHDHFEGITINVPCGPVTQDIDITVIAENGTLNFYASLVGCYAGDVRFGGKRHYFVLCDRTLDCIYKNFFTGDNIDKCDYMGIDFDGGGGIDNDSFGKEVFPLSKIVRIRDEYYSVLPSADGKKVTIEKANPKLGILDVQNSDIELSTASSEGYLRFERSGGKWQLPAGTYSIYSLDMIKKDSKGYYWNIECIVDESQFSKFDIQERKTTTMALGTPFLLKTKINVIGNEVVITPLITGKGGEKYHYVINPYNNYENVPEFRIVDNDGKEILSASFKDENSKPSLYSWRVPDEFNGDFCIVIEPNFGPFEWQQEKKWYLMRELRQIFEINKIYWDDVSDAVDKAPIIYEDINKELLSFDNRFALAQALTLAGNYDDSLTILTDLAAEKATGDLAYAKWIWWHAGWTAWLSGNDKKAADIFRKILINEEGSPVLRKDWKESEWIAAWFLGKAADNDFVVFFAEQKPNMVDDPYFFAGEKFMKAGKIKEAKTFYLRCIEMTKISKDVWPANWAKWRLKQMEGK